MKRQLQDKGLEAVVQNPYYHHLSHCPTTPSTSSSQYDNQYEQPSAASYDEGDALDPASTTDTKRKFCTATSKLGAFLKPDIVPTETRRSWCEPHVVAQQHVAEDYRLGNYHQHQQHSSLWNSNTSHPTWTTMFGEPDDAAFPSVYTSEFLWQSVSVAYDLLRV